MKRDHEIEAYVFDAYGTLFDVHSAVRRHAGRIGHEAERLSELWRTKQLEYTWVLSLAGGYEDFETLTKLALDFAMARLGIENASMKRDLLAAYDALQVFPDVMPALLRLKTSGKKLAVLTNATAPMLGRAISSSGLADVFDALFSVDVVRVFKTDPATYRLVTDGLGLAPGQISFQSSNRWDVAGASRFGFRTVWVNRSGAPDEYQTLPPVATVRSLDALPGQIE